MLTIVGPISILHEHFVDAANMAIYFLGLNLANTTRSLPSCVELAYNFPR